MAQISAELASAIAEAQRRSAVDERRASKRRREGDDLESEDDSEDVPARSSPSMPMADSDHGAIAINFNRPARSASEIVFQRNAAILNKPLSTLEDEDDGDSFPIPLRTRKSKDTNAPVVVGEKRKR